VTDGTTWYDVAQTMRHLAVLTYFVSQKWHDSTRRALREQNSCQCEACLRQMAFATLDRLSTYQGCNGRQVVTRLWIV